MTSNVGKKVFIQIETTAEQEEHLKQQRKTLKVLQGVAKDKENLTGRKQIDKLSRLKAAACADLAVSAFSGDQAKRKKIDTKIAETQTTPQRNQNVNEHELEKKAQEETEQKLQSASAASKQISIDDLTGEAAPSEQYWERLAEKRREALEKTLEENQRLHERIDGLEEELNTSRQQLEEAQHLVAILTEMLNEEESNEPTDENDEEQTEDTSFKSIAESVQEEEEAEHFQDCMDKQITSKNPTEDA